MGREVTSQLITTSCLLSESWNQAKRVEGAGMNGNIQDNLERI